MPAAFLHPSGRLAGADARPGAARLQEPQYGGLEFAVDGCQTAPPALFRTGLYVVPIIAPFAAPLDFAPADLAVFGACLIIAC
jgi:hypothetical protein